MSSWPTDFTFSSVQLDVYKIQSLSSWNTLETIDISNIKEHIAPLIKPKNEDELARRFDYLIYSIDLGMLKSKNVQIPVNIVVQTAEKLSAKYSIPEVKKQKDIIEKVQTTDFWDEMCRRDRCWT